MERPYNGPLDEHPDYESIASLFRIFSNSTSLRIALELRNGEMSLSTIARKIRVTPEQLLREMLKMVQQRIVYARRHGKSIIYCLQYPETIDALDLIHLISERRFSRARSDGAALQSLRDVV